MKIVTIAHNAVTAKLVNADRDTKQDVQACMSYNVQGYEHMPMIGDGWDGKANFLSFNAGTFPRGFVHYVQTHLTKLGYKVNVVRKPFPEPIGPEHPVVDEFPEEERYDYQKQVVDKLVRHGQIIAQIA